MAVVDIRYFDNTIFCSLHLGRHPVTVVQFNNAVKQNTHNRTCIAIIIYKHNNKNT